MSETEERLQALEEKYAALEKRVEVLDAVRRVKLAERLADAECDAVFGDATKSERDAHVVMVKGGLSMLFAGSTIEKAKEVYAVIAANLDAQVHEVLDASVASASDGETREVLVDIANCAREHGITFRELNLPRP